MNNFRSSKIHDFSSTAFVIYKHRTCLFNFPQNAIIIKDLCQYTCVCKRIIPVYGVRERLFVISLMETFATGWDRLWRLEKKTRRNNSGTNGHIFPVRHTRCPGCCSKHVFLSSSGKLNCLEVGSEGSDL